jgi:Neprosin
MKKYQFRVWSFQRTFAAAVASVGIMCAGISHSQPTDTIAGSTNVTPQVNDSEERQARQQDLAEYLLKCKRRLDILGIQATTPTSSGQIIYWIRPESQVQGGVLAKPPPIPIELPLPLPPPAAGERRQPLRSGSSSPQASDLAVMTELQAASATLGPEGTVPIVCPPLERILATTEFLPIDPAKLLTKLPPQYRADGSIKGSESNRRYYVASYRYRPSEVSFGTSGWINTWDTKGPENNETSIAQTAVIRGDPMQAIEAGKIELDLLNGDTRPHFFTFYRTYAEAEGDWIGGYNAINAGWIQVGRRVAPGMLLLGESKREGPQYSLRVEVRLWKGNWWVWAAGEWAGYYPYCKGGDITGGDTPQCAERTLFSECGIRDKAEYIGWFGEVFDSTAPDAATSTDMGSGEFAKKKNNWQRTAYFRNLTFFWKEDTYYWWDGSDEVRATDDACYNFEGPFTNHHNPHFQNYFFYGGPGKEAPACR